MEYVKKDLGEQIAEGLCQSAEAYREKDEFKKSKELYLEALRWRVELIANNREYYQPLIVKTLNALAVVSKEDNEYDFAIRYYKQSISVGEMLFRDDSNKNARNLSKSYADLADLYRRENNYVKAQEYYKKALDVEEGLGEKRRLNAYNHLALICHVTNQYEDAKKAYVGALDIYKSLVEDNSDEYKEALALTLFSLGSLYVQNRRQNRAKEVYLLALELLLYLDDIEPNKHSDMSATIFHNLGKIYTDQLAYADGLASYRTALNYFIAMAEVQPMKYAPLVARVFTDLASFHKKRNKMKMAQYFHLKAVDIYLELAHYNESAYALVFVSSIIDGVMHYEQHTLTLYQAELILESYFEEEKSDALLEKIHSIREECGVIS